MGNGVSGVDHLREKQLREFLIYLGKLTYEVNNFQSSEGVIRDSDAKRRSRGTKGSTKRQKIASVGKLAKVCVKRFTKVHVGVRSCRGAQGQHRTTQASMQTWMGRAKLASLEASFFNSWRADHAGLLKPSGGASASERMDALKARIVARGAAHH